MSRYCVLLVERDVWRVMRVIASSYVTGVAPIELIDHHKFEKVRFRICTVLIYLSLFRRMILGVEKRCSGIVSARV